MTSSSTTRHRRRLAGLARRLTGRYGRGWRPVRFFPSLRTDERRRQGMFMFLLDGLLANISESFVGPYLSLYLLALGATGGQVGLLASVTSFVGALMFLPGARLAARFPNYRNLVVAASLGARAALPLLILVPPLVGGQGAIASVILFAAMRAGFTQLGNPAWTALSAALVPVRLRGRYFSSRTFAMSLAAVVAVPLAGRLISTLGAPRGYQVSFGLALVAGLLASFCYSRIPLLGTSRRRPQPFSLGQALLGLRARPGFVRFWIISMILGFSVNVAGPFFNVHLVRDLGASAGFVGIFTTVNTAATLVGTRLFGPLVDRRGLRWTMVRTSPFVALIPFAWLFPRQAWQALPISAMGGLAWAGYNLAVFNLLLATTAEGDRPLYSAIYNTGHALAVMLGPLLGGLLYDGWGFQAPLIVSSLGRGTAALLVFLLIREATRPQPAPPEPVRTAAGHAPDV